MHALKLTTRVREDHRLEVILPDDTPIGEAEVTVLFKEPDLLRPSHSLREFNEKLEHLPCSGRSQAEIDRYLEDERNSWE